MPTYTITDPFSLLLLMITERIKAEVAGIDQVVKDLGQLEVQQRPAIMPYTVLVSFQNWSFSDEGEHIQMGEGDVVIKVTAPFYNIVDSETPVDSQEDALKYLALSQAVFLKLHGWVPEIENEVEDLFGPMTRVGWSEDQRRPGLGVMVHRYRVNLEDRSAKIVKTKTPVTLGLTVTYQDPGE